MTETSFIRPMLCPKVIGRDDVLWKLDMAVAEARDGRGGLGVVLGEAGIGKSRLVNGERRE